MTNPMLKKSDVSDNAENSREMILNVRKSSDSALKALTLFYRSLVAAKLPESSRSYRSMCDTLLGQKIWMLDKEDVQTKANFDELSQVAEKIISILEPYNDAFKKLISDDVKVNPNGDVSLECSDNPAYDTAVGDTNENAPLLDSPKKSNEEMVLRIIGQQKRMISMTKLRAETKLRKKELDEIIENLLSGNCIASKRVNGRDLYGAL